MRFKQIGGKADAVTITAKNADTVSIPAGSPLVLSMSGSDDGLAVVLPSTAGGAKANALLYGVAPSIITVGQTVDCLAFGYVPVGKITVATRGASTNDWSSSDSIASWGVLAVDTLNDAFLVQTESQAQGDFIPYAVLAQSIASVASSGSATTDTRTAITTTKRIFVRML